MLDRPTSRSGWDVCATAPPLEGRAFIDRAVATARRAVEVGAWRDLPPEWIDSVDTSSLAPPFDGCKQSGFGRDRSPEAVEEDIDVKTVWTAYN